MAGFCSTLCPQSLFACILPRILFWVFKMVASEKLSLEAFCSSSDSAGTGVPVKSFSTLWLAHLPASSSGIVDTEQIFAELEDPKSYKRQSCGTLWASVLEPDSLVSQACLCNYLGDFGQEFHHFVPYFSCKENTSMPQKVTVKIKWVNTVKCTNQLALRSIWCYHYTGPIFDSDINWISVLWQVDRGQMYLCHVPGDVLSCGEKYKQDPVFTLFMQ